MVMTPTAVGRFATTSWLRPACEKLLSALEKVRGNDADGPESRAALCQAVTSYVRALRAEGISAPWVLESVVAFARGVAPRRARPVTHDPVEADVVRWSLAALEWPGMRYSLGDSIPGGVGQRG
jgi:hypothetical protein